MIVTRRRIRIRHITQGPHWDPYSATKVTVEINDTK